MWNVESGKQIATSNRVDFQFPFLVETNEMLTTDKGMRDSNCRALLFVKWEKKNNIFSNLNSAVPGEEKMEFLDMETATLIRLSVDIGDEHQTKNVVFILRVLFCFRRHCKDRQPSLFYSTQKQNHCELCDFHKFHFIQKIWIRKMKTLKWFSVRSVGFVVHQHVVLLFCHFGIVSFWNFWFIFEPNFGDWHTHSHTHTNVASGAQRGSVSHQLIWLRADVRTKVQLALDG